MSSDFRPVRITTLATTDNALAGVRAVRNATALTYKLVRVSMSKVGDGVEDTFVIPGAVVPGDDVAEVWVADAKKTVTTDYTITDRIITFEAGSIPADGATVKVLDVSADAGIVPAGGVTFFDTNRMNSPSWDYIRADGATVVEVM